MRTNMNLGAAAVTLTLAVSTGTIAAAQEVVPTFDELLAHKIALKPELVGVHPRVFVTKAGLEALRERARTTHRAEWSKVIENLAALKSPPPPAPGPQERRSQNNAAFAIAEASFAWAVERKPEFLSAAKAWRSICELFFEVSPNFLTFSAPWISGVSERY